MFNDAAYGAEIHQYGSQGLDTTPMLPDEVGFAAHADAAGGTGVRVESLYDLDALRQGQEDGSPGVLLLDCRVSPSVVAPFMEEIIAATARAPARQSRGTAPSLPRQSGTAALADAPLRRGGATVASSPRVRPDLGTSARAGLPIRRLRPSGCGQDWLVIDEDVTFDVKWSPQELELLQARADAEQRSVEDVVHTAVAEYVSRHNTHDLFAHAHNRDLGDLSGLDNG